MSDPRRLPLPRAARGLALALAASFCLSSSACDDAGGPTGPATPEPVPAPGAPVLIAAGLGAAELPDLEPHLTPAEIAALEDGFDWSATRALAETGEEGGPSLHYGLVAINSHTELGALDRLQIHHDALPLLEEERAAWRGKTGRVAPLRTRRGVLRYVVVPAAAYNLLRAAALRGKPPFQLLALRPVPAALRAADGSLSYRALAAAGFRYRGLDPQATAPAGEPVTRRRFALLDASQRAVYDDIANRLADVPRAIARTLGRYDRDGILGRGGAGGAKLTLTLRVLNTDSYFGRPAPPTNGSPPVDDMATVMVRAWGQAAGAPVPLPGVKVRLWSKGDGTVLNLPTLFEGTTDDQSTVTLNVAKKRPVTGLCIEASNAAAELTEFFGAVQVCSFQDDTTAPIAQLTGDAASEVRVQHRYFNMLAQFTEGHTYLRKVVGFTPHRAKILVGQIGDLSGSATAGCLGFPSPAVDAILEGLVASLAATPFGVLLLPIVQMAGPVLAVDMWIGGDATYSRGIPSHEYGHFALCSMLYAHNPSTFSSSYLQAAIQRFKDGGTPPASSTAAVDNEAFADFIAAQIAGGVNYWSPVTTEEDSYGMSYCQNAPAAALPDGTVPVQACVEDNSRYSASNFDARVAHAATVLHDAFDGWFPDPISVGIDAPGNGNAWRVTHPLPEDGPFPGPQLVPWVTYVDRRDGDQHDENVTLPGNALLEFVSKLATLEEQDFMRALVDTMRDHGVPFCDMCRLFAIHSELYVDDATTPIGTLCGATVIHSWLGDPPPDVNCDAACRPDQLIFQNSCVDVCPDGFFSIEGDPYCHSEIG